MRRFTVGLALSVAFAVGCVTSQLVVPRARAQASGGAMAQQRWEYICVDGWAGVTHSANQLGKEGWEMASAAGTSDHMMWCFKRALP